MYNPDQHYQAHAFHLKDLYESQQRHAMGHAVGTRLGVVLVRLGTWPHCMTWVRAPACLPRQEALSKK